MSRPAKGCIWVALPTVYTSIFLPEGLFRSYSSANDYALPTYSVHVTRPSRLISLDSLLFFFTRDLWYTYSL
jgi:hypothetical protein